jgi:predicted TIM-barrel fold metal-dependent hydrolase
VIGHRAQPTRTSPWSINHCGSPIDADAEAWRAGAMATAILAREPNIMIKVSNIQAYDPSPDL